MAFILALAWVLAGASAAGPLDYSPAPFPSTVTERGRTSEGTRYLVKFPTALKSPFKANNTVWGHFFAPTGPAGRRYPCILVLPVMAAPNIWIENQFMKRFRRDGFAVMWIEMPYQFHRVPAPLVPSGQVFLARTARQLAFNFRESALDARRALAWLKTCRGVDAGRIGIFGISLGALVGSAVYSVDTTPKYAVFLLGGADFPDLVERSAMTKSFMRRLSITPAEIAKSWPGLDPLDYRAKNKGKPVFLMNGWFDDIIPRANARKLKAAFPDSRQVLVPFGHYSAIVNLFWLPGYVSGKFKAHLG
ncbi:MAG: alpha/beta hydrolase family protein [Elusimicrobiota bacterium]